MVKKGYYIAKRKTFPFGRTKRRLVLVKGEKATTTPLNRMIKGLKLGKGYTISGSGRREVVLEKIVKHKKK